MDLKLIYIYIYITETFGAPTIFHIILILKKIQPKKNYFYFLIRVIIIFKTTTLF